MALNEYKLFCTKCDAICEGFGSESHWETDCLICEWHGNGRSFMEGFRILDGAIRF